MYSLYNQNNLMGKIRGRSQTAQTLAQEPQPPGAQPLLTPSSAVGFYPVNQVELSGASFVLRKKKKAVLDVFIPLYITTYYILRNRLRTSGFGELNTKCKMVKSPTKSLQKGTIALLWLASAYTCQRNECSRAFPTPSLSLEELG